MAKGVAHGWALLFGSGSGFFGREWNAMVMVMDMVMIPPRDALIAFYRLLNELN